ncbi:response regulator [Paenibacillaceae bacterium WGS1546]|uniref:response regulator n=1 Tax=Cohnella sp. WGS1546 TaxID=3366810 RepID=UPI00372D65B6
MFKILLVDDEVDIREGLAHLIDWHSFGFTVAGQAANGRDGLELLQSSTFHLVITDISMPVLNGLELIKEMRRLNLQQSVLILSGYNDFAYLKEALLYRVENYLLKPVNENELAASLIQIREDICNEIESNLREKENMSILRSKLLNRLVTRSISKLEFLNKADFLQISLSAPAYRILVIELESATELYDKAGERIEHLKLFSAMNVCQEVLQRVTDGILFEDSYQHLVYIAKLKGDHLPWVELAENIKISLKTYVKEPASVIIGPEVHGLGNIPHSYNEALRMLEYKFYLGREATISPERLPNRKFANDIEFEKECQSLGEAVFQGDYGACLRITAHLFERFTMDGLASKAFVQNAAFELIMAALKQVKEANGDIRQILPEPERLYMDISSQSTLADIHSLLNERLLSIADYLTKLKTTRPIKIIKSVIEYIHANYNRDPTLKQAAEIHYMNPGYLGKLFKRETGTSFHDYLNNVRIEKAKQLLTTTNHFVYQVSEMVGYRDYNYFHRTFKKHAGVSPSDFART